MNHFWSIIGGICSFISLILVLLFAGGIFKTVGIIVLCLILLLCLIILFRDQLTTVVYKVRPKQSLEKETGNADILWVAAHTLSVISAETDFILDRHAADRVLLIHPESTAIRELSRSTNESVEKLKQDIISATNNLVKHKKSVKWYDGLLGSSIILFNPRLRSGWVRIESQLTGLSPDKRPSLKIFRRFDESLQEKYVKVFERLWEDSQEPQNQ